MSAVASKNLYELLGNDPEEDSDKEVIPVKVVDKTPARVGKRNGPAEPAAAPKAAAPVAVDGRGGRRGGFTGNEAAFRDRTAGSASNRGKPTDEAPRGRGRGRGGPRRGGDRHSRALASDSEKQAAHGWGATEGNAELNDEKAGEAIAQTEQKEAIAEDGEKAEDAPPPEPEDKSISYDVYLAQQAEKKLALGGGLEVRKANEGTKEDKKWASAKAITKEEDEDFISGSGGKSKRERERKTKQVVEIDQQWVEERGERSGRGGRGGRGRGDFRGGRGEGRGRGGRGEFRGRGGRGGAAPINTSDESAFPSLGA